MSKKYNWGKTSLKRMNGLDERLIKVLFRALQISSKKKDGIDFTIPQYGGLRTADRQNKLFENGFSKCDGYEKKSFHQTQNILYWLKKVENLKQTLVKLFGLLTH